MARRILNRKEMRADFDAAERRTQGEDEETEVEEGAEGDDDEDEEEAAESDEEARDEEEEAPAPPKKAARKKPAKAPAAKSRSRSAKSVRMRVVWGIFNNSHQCVATYEYPKRKEAEEHAAKLTADKKSTHFIQPVKEPMPVE
jgi:hypothetical protein